MKKKNHFELMAPAGNFPGLVAACKAGADAVYFGLNCFSMRAGKRNFKISDLDRIRKICHSFPEKKKIYLTLNTIVYDSEIKKLETIIKKIKNKVDAVICWDLSVINLCRIHKIPFFVSTQASIANKQAALFYKNLGAQRVILARELNLSQIKEINKINNLEIEVFIHGAMCVSVSGRCFTSQFLFNKSANRGECFHPCRRSYLVKDEKYGHQLKVENKRIMSAKDVCCLPFIEQLKKINVKSFKIEGRNRDPRYIDTVVKVYREALDNKLDQNRIKFLMKKLDQVYHRGFSSGFYLGKPLKTDFSQVENSASKYYRSFLGKIVHLYPKAGTALINLIDCLSYGDQIIVIHDKIGIAEMKVSRMEINNQQIKKAVKGEVVAIKFPFKVFKNSEVYKIKKKTN